MADVPVQTGGTADDVAPVLRLVRDHPEQPLWGVFNLAAHSVTQHAPEADLRPVAAGLIDACVRRVAGLHLGRDLGEYLGSRGWDAALYSRRYKLWPPSEAGPVERKYPPRGRVLHGSGGAVADR